MKSITLYGRKGVGLQMLVDDEDYDRMNQHKWYYHDGYAISVKHVAGNKKNRFQNILIAHRYVLNLKKGDMIIVDHINRNRLDNRKENLYKGDYKRNSANVNREKVSNAGYIGVKIESENCYLAICHGKTIGYYDTAIDAALAYDQYARVYFNGLSTLNFPEITTYDNIKKKSEKHNKHPRSSTVVGVSYSHTRRAQVKWRCVYKKIHIGWFYTEEEAIAALERFKERYHNENQTNK